MLAAIGPHDVARFARLGSLATCGPQGRAGAGYARPLKTTMTGPSSSLLADLVQFPSCYGVPSGRRACGKIGPWSLVDVVDFLAQVKTVRQLDAGSRFEVLRIVP